MSTNTNEEVVSSKRRRTAANKNTCINDFPPDGILSNVATYLATPSVVLFAIAIQHDSASSSNSQTSNAIMSATTSNGGEQQQLNILDFGDIEKRLAAKLTDDHITTILNCISASNNLKTLKLAGCVNITGSCLEVIRSSAVLELLDLSLVGKHESPILDTEPLLSESAVIPILDHIIGNSRSLKLLHLPKTFRMNQSTEVEQFLERCNRYLSSFGYTCSKCETVCDDTGFERWIVRGGYESYEGAQNYTCSGCLAYFCFNECVDDSGEDYIFWCDKCENHYCKECMTSIECEGGCHKTFCTKCDPLKSMRRT